MMKPVPDFHLAAQSTAGLAGLPGRARRATVRPPRALGLLAIASVAMALGGCAMAPGVDIRRHVELPPGTPAPDAPPPGALTPITPVLVQALRTSPEPDPFVELKDFLKDPQPYRIGPADVLSITVWGSTDFSSPAGNLAASANAGAGFTVSARGAVQVPFLGDVQAAGMTIEEFRDHLTERLKKMLREPQVTVGIQTYRSGRVYVDGEVARPGLQVLNDLPMSLPEALSRAGGLTTDADRSAITVTRGVKSVRINPDALLQRGLDPLKILLEPSDVVRVPSRGETVVYVLGEVRGAGPKPFRRGKLSLHEALGDAGGLDQAAADPRQVYVVRVTDPLKPEVYHLDMASPVAMGLAAGFMLLPRDVVYVDPVPLVRWNRVVNLVLPSASAITTTGAAVNSVR